MRYSVLHNTLSLSLCGIQYSWYNGVHIAKSHSEFTICLLQSIARRHPSYVHLDMSYHSRNGNPQPIVRITNFTSMLGQAPFQNIVSNRAVLLLSYGEHAREFLPVESMFYLIQNITDGLCNNTDYYAKKFSSYIVSNMDIFIVAIVNPDGRELVEKTSVCFFLMDPFAISNMWNTISLERSDIQTHNAQ